MTTQSPIQNTQEMAGTWLKACKTNDLVVNSGVCALVENKQIAIFAVSAINAPNDISLYACDNYDPCGKANVMSRGLLCSIAGEMAICSPLYKQHFSLLDGHCFEQDDVSISVYPVKLVDDAVMLFLPLSQTE